MQYREPDGGGSGINNNGNTPIGQNGGINSGNYNHGQSQGYFDNPMPQRPYLKSPNQQVISLSNQLQIIHSTPQSS